MRAAIVAIALVLTGACTAPPQQVQHVPESHPVDTAFLKNDCVACHTADLVAQQRLTDKQWPKSVDKMRGWGAPTEDDEVQPLLAGLLGVASRDAGPYVPKTISAHEAAQLFTTAPDGKLGGGDVKKGRDLYADRCSPCHADDARGGTMGVALAGRHVLDRAPDFARAIRAGRGRMPEYPETTDAEIADMIAYLRSIKAP
ncbi:MAG TPA: c-type cytochrome [Candidatus Polarisedimenticolaceae bacterium]|nr:c-type cytochrome [Candidatus Polarisedimenticolaceae bacterium]